MECRHSFLLVDNFATFIEKNSIAVERNANLIFTQLDAFARGFFDYCCGTAFSIYYSLRIGDICSQKKINIIGFKIVNH